MTKSTEKKTILRLANKVRAKIMFKSIRSWPEAIALMDFKQGEYDENIITENKTLDVKGFNKVIESAVSILDGNSLPPIIKTETKTHERASVDNLIKQDTKNKGYAIPSPIKEEDTSSTNNSEAFTLWQPPPIPKRQKAKLFKTQQVACKRLYYNFYEQPNMRGQMLISATGSGKTFMFGQLCNWALEHQKLDDLTLGPYPIMIVTKAPVVIKTQRDLQHWFGLGKYDFIVCSYDSLRSTFGRTSYIRVDTRIEDGIEYETFRWARGIIPRLIILDEIQAAKNEQSLQSKIIQSLSKASEPDLKVLAVSATPYTRISEAKAVVCNLGIEYNR